MADILFPDGTTLADVVANLNSFATLPTTSRGAGEIIHYSGDNTIRWNSQTTNPTTNPTWSDLSAGGWDGNATSNLDMNGYSIEEVNTINANILSSYNTGKVSLVHSLIPSIDNWIDLGSSALKFDTIYVNVITGISSNLAMGTNKITGLGTPTVSTDAATKGYADALPGTNAATFKINQDNAGAEASAIEFDRGSEATAARIHWSEANDRFTFEEVTGSTLAKVRAKQLDVQDQINLDDTVGTVMIKKNDSTGDMELQVAAGDSIVFKAV